MYSKESKLFFCKRLRILSKLKSEGFRPFATIPDRDNPRKDVWLFDNSDELYRSVQEYYANMPIEKR